MTWILGAAVIAVVWFVGFVMGVVGASLAFVQKDPPNPPSITGPEVVRYLDELEHL